MAQSRKNRKSRGNRKSRSNSKGIMRTLRRTTAKALPAADRGLKTVGNVAKGVIKTTVPIVEKGVSAVYGTMATGFNLGVKGVSKVSDGVQRVASGRKRSRKSRR